MGFRTVCACGLFAVIMAGPAPSSQSGNALELLRKVRSSYSNLKSFRFTGTVALESVQSGTKGTTEFPFEADYVAPDKLRVEKKSALIGAEVISDGHAVWIYIPSTKTFTKTTIGSLGLLTGTSGKENHGQTLFSLSSGVAGLSFDLFQVEIDENVKRAALTGEESLDIGGRKIDCYVVEADYSNGDPGKNQGPKRRTFWIDKGRFIVLREVSEFRVASPLTGSPIESKQTIVFESAEVNTPLPPALFTFTPPEGAKEGQAP